MTEDNLSVESFDNLESNVRNESAAFREDVNDIFDRLYILDNVKMESAPDIVSSCSDFSETAS